MSDKVAHSRGHGTAVKGFVNVDLSGLDSLFEVCGASMCILGNLFRNFQVNSDDACEDCIICIYTLAVVTLILLCSDLL